MKKTTEIEGRRLLAADGNASVAVDMRTVVYGQEATPGWDIRKIDNYR